MKKLFPIINNVFLFNLYIVVPLYASHPSSSDDELGFYFEDDFLGKKTLGTSKVEGPYPPMLEPGAIHEMSNLWGKTPSPMRPIPVSLITAEKTDIESEAHQVIAGQSKPQGVQARLAKYPSFAKFQLPQQDWRTSSDTSLYGSSPMGSKARTPWRDEGCLDEEPELFGQSLPLNTTVEITRNSPPQCDTPISWAAAKKGMKQQQSFMGISRISRSMPDLDFCHEVLFDEEGPLSEHENLTIKSLMKSIEGLCDKLDECTREQFMTLRIIKDKLPRDSSLRNNFQVGSFLERVHVPYTKDAQEICIESVHPGGHSHHNLRVAYFVLDQEGERILKTEFDETLKLSASYLLLSLQPQIKLPLTLPVEHSYARKAIRKFFRETFDQYNRILKELSKHAQLADIWGRLVNAFHADGEWKNLSEALKERGIRVSKQGCLKKCEFDEVYNYHYHKKAKGDVFFDDILTSAPQHIIDVLVETREKDGHNVISLKEALLKLLHEVKALVKGVMAQETY